MQSRSWQVGVGVAFAMLLTGAWWVVRQAEASRTEAPVLGEVPVFTFIDHERLPFGRDRFRGKVSVVDFIFTSCRGPCPVMTGKMAVLYRQFEGDPRVQFVSFTVDPDIDTPEVLANYALGLGVGDGRWRFVRGEKPEVAELATRGFLLGGTLPELHSTRFVLVDSEARIRGYYSGTDDAAVAQLRQQVRALADQLADSRN